MLGKQFGKEINGWETFVKKVIEGKDDKSNPTSSSQGEASQSTGNQPTSQPTTSVRSHYYQTRGNIQSKHNKTSLNSSDSDTMDQQIQITEQDFWDCTKTWKKIGYGYCADVYLGIVNVSFCILPF